MTDLTRQLRGKEISAVLCNGNMVLIQTACGAEIYVKWVDENGATIQGRPVIAQKGFRLKLRGFRDLVLGPKLGV